MTFHGLALNPLDELVERGGLQIDPNQVDHRAAVFELDGKAHLEEVANVLRDHYHARVDAHAPIALVIREFGDQMRQGQVEARVLRVQVLALAAG